MSEPPARSGNVRWNISATPEFDESTRLFLAPTGGRKGSLSALVQKAVSRYILSERTAEAKKKVKDSGLSQPELDKIIADGIAWAKEQPR